VQRSSTWAGDSAIRLLGKGAKQLAGAHRLAGFGRAGVDLLFRRNPATVAIPLAILAYAVIALGASVKTS
jgi:hypothetical protein